MKTLDGATLTRHWKKGFLGGPSQEDVLICARLIAQDKRVDVFTFGTTRGECPYRLYPIRFTAVAVTDKDMFVIEGRFDYTSYGSPDGSRSLHGKRVRLNFNSHTRASTHVYSEE
jgi:hypothetical protein